MEKPHFAILQLRPQDPAPTSSLHFAEKFGPLLDFKEYSCCFLNISSSSLFQAHDKIVLPGTLVAGAKVTT